MEKRVNYGRFREFYCINQPTLRTRGRVKNKILRTYILNGCPMLTFRGQDAQYPSNFTQPGREIKKLTIGLNATRD